jgi:predicted enzyme related to lactoylglutathione lyase
MPPTLGNGKICYLEIPAIDIGQSATFYQAVAGWQTRQRGDGRVAFDDGVGQVSGTWVTGRPASATPGVLIYIMVDSVAATLPEITARFRDPAGNNFGLYQDPTTTR